MPYLKDLFNTIYEEGSFPAEWSESIIVPLHKKGSRDEPNKYRAISLISSISKIFTNILNKRLTSWCEENDVIIESQAGFRRNYSTVDNIFNLQAVIQKYLCKKRGRMYVFFIDFFKAFDSCVHDNLWRCLIRKGIKDDSKFLNIFKSMYSNLRSCVKVKDGLTRFFNCSIGTKQGCVSSPLIFSLFINDLADFLKVKCENGVFINDNTDDIYAFLFADDIASTADTKQNLQRQINCIEQFCSLTGMKINVEKSKIMVFRNAGALRSYEKWFYNGEQIEVVQNYKYLEAFLRQPCHGPKPRKY